MSSPDILEFGYTNWRGEYSVRRVMPVKLYWGASEYHKERQWLLLAYDVDREQDRTFAFKDMRLDCPRCRDIDAAVVNEHKHDPYSRR